MSLARTTQLIAGLLFRRFLNRMRAGFGRRKKKPEQRTGTGRKASGSIVLMGFLALMFIFQSVNISSLTLRSISGALGPMRDGKGRIEVSLSTYIDLTKLELDFPNSRADRERKARTIFLSDHGPDIDYDRQTAQATELQRWYHQKGRDGFVRVKTSSDIFLPKLRAWTRPELQPTILKALGSLLLLLAAARFCLTLGSANQDLGKIEWSTEWLFSFPVPASHLFAAQMLGHALVDPFSWFATLPFLFAVFYSANFGWWAAPTALGGMLYLGVITAVLRVLSETWLRKRLPPAQLKNLQALFTLFGIGLLFSLLLLSRGGAPVMWLVAKAQAGSMGLVLNPFSLPAALCTMSPGPLIFWQVAIAMGTVLAGTGCCVRLVRGGLVATSGVYIGKRGLSAGASRTSLLPSGIIGKDMRLLLRDRNFLVQTLIAPVLVVGFQLLNGGLAHSITSSFQAASTFAYGLGAYVLISTALSVLAVEGNSLWMLYSLPVPLHRVMLRKTLLWACCALAYTVIALVACAARIRSFHLLDLVHAAMACAGVFIYAFIAAGIGILGTDPLETEVKRRVGPGTIYLYMILATMFGYALHAPSMWARIAQLVLSSLLAYALWQKVRDRSPFLLDPVSAPPPQISLADGLIAALAFFVVQGLVTMIAIACKLSIGPAITVAFSVAGALVVLFTFLSYWRTPWVLLTGRPGEPRKIAISAGLGVLSGILAGGIGLAYIAAVHRLPFLQSLRDDAAQLHGLRGWWLVLLAVVAAPLFEEFIFRGVHLSRTGFSWNAPLPAPCGLYLRQRRRLRDLPSAHFCSPGVRHGLPRRVEFRTIRPPDNAHCHAHDLQHHPRATEPIHALKREIPACSLLLIPLLPPEKPASPR